MPSLSHTNYTPPHPTGNKGTGQPLCTHSVLHCSSRKHSLGTQTWRVMEEVDNTLLRCVEEGSCHGVVLSVSTEKLEGKERKSLDCQLWAAPQQGKRPFSSWCRAGGTAHSKNTNAKLHFPPATVLLVTETCAKQHHSPGGFTSLRRVLRQGVQSKLKVSSSTQSRGQWLQGNQQGPEPQAPAESHSPAQPQGIPHLRCSSPASPTCRG